MERHLSQVGPREWRWWLKNDDGRTIAHGTSWTEDGAHRGLYQAEHIGPPEKDDEP